MKPSVNMENLFDYMEKHKCELFAFKELFVESINTFLANQTPELLHEINEFAKQNENHIMFRIDSTMYRIKYLMTVFEEEFKNNCVLFCNNCSDLDTLISKLTECTFALRRIELNISNDFVDAAMSWMANNAPSPISVYAIYENEILARKEVLFDRLLDFYSSTDMNELAKKILTGKTQNHEST